MEDRALLKSNPSAMAGPNGTGGVDVGAACFILEDGGSAGRWSSRSR